MSRAELENARPFSLEPVQRILAFLLLIELIVFSIAGNNFLTVGNGFEVLRLSVEIGLLAIALTPVILTGGIDLSVGSLMGLAAVVMGKLWRDLGVPLPVAGGAALLLGATAGTLNGYLITRRKLPPLIVTLGTFSLFRGLAEGLTAGVDNFTNFPARFLYLGQGYLFGFLPTQVPIFLVVALAFWLLVHRGVPGRIWTAIGYSGEGARHAGLPVDRATMLVYILSGLTAGLSATIYVAHLGQAKADAGTGYELLAITAVVLGGTSIFGGRGSVMGTLLGLFAIAVLQNGMRLSDLPAELSGVLTGILLLVAIGLDRPEHGRKRTTTGPETDNAEEWTVKNTQVAVLCGVILAAALIVAGSNYYLARSLTNNERGTASGFGNEAKTGSSETPITGQDRPITVAMMPKSKGNAYFIACRKGAEEAARELGVELIWDGPTDPDPARQNQIIDTWITRGVDVIAVAVENRDGITSVLQKARDRGIKVLTWDADSAVEGRDFFVNQATPEGIGRTLMDHTGRILGGKGQFAIITASLTAGNMIAWQEQIELRRKEKWPNIEMAVLRPCDDLYKKAYDETNTILNAHPDVRLIMGICTPAVPAAGEAVKQSGRSDVKVIGLGLPNDNRRYVHEGITDSVVLWDTADLGYLTVLASQELALGRLKAGATQIEAGRLGTIQIAGDNILLGEPVTFNKDNIDDYDF